ncbi:T9SS type A sorting domain-containing protein, partial [candidate division KSB1 bacterium]|nr:T9SS type A sorting domain-containing protein [candidate division KSB1 bacterium]NIR65485.1 T9SS type A sorting domain-containing protein [candidate division Zixibacteria bacterium]NIW44667.1 T9SS type A sorting domain-containing protein [Gammaproteobacteria bacterium]NIS47171.1 T9SS type A sorting domain-containing protein [candidate division Zixibacteria bacterium]NIT70912.1 T9SS type A sorting domain-containing protein [candidate division KSB1 bacterium]
AVDTSGPNRPVFDPEIIVDSQGKIHLVYSRSIDGDLFPDFLFHRWSLDGSQWSPLDSFPDNFPGRHYPAIIHLDSLDRLDAIWYHDSDVGTDGLMHSVFENNSWSEPEFLFQTRYSFHYVIDENGILHLVWSGEWNGVQGVYYSQKDLITATDPVKPVAVKGFKLNQNYPNPFNPSTSITFQLPHQASVELKVFDIQGRLVRTLVNKTLPGGQHRVSWNGRNDRG